jgi:hypothetical protein
VTNFFLGFYVGGMLYSGLALAIDSKFSGSKPVSVYVAGSILWPIALAFGLTRLDKYKK